MRHWRRATYRNLSSLRFLGLAMAVKPVGLALCCLVLFELVGSIVVVPLALFELLVVPVVLHSVGRHSALITCGEIQV